MDIQEKGPNCEGAISCMEQIKDIIYLRFGKHILYTQAEEILTGYRDYINKKYISLMDYACARFEQGL